MTKKVLTSVEITEDEKTKKLTFKINLTSDNKELFLLDMKDGQTVPKKIIKNIIIN